jgi:outer membrane lipoprotein SlyB
MSMTRKLTILCAACTLSLAAGCSSAPERTSPPTGTETVGGSPSPSESTQYGTVRNIQEKQAAQRSSGGGAIIGAVVGGALGNQVGSGTGRAAATAAGVLGGAVVGDQIERARREPSQNYYQIDVRLDNGDFRSFDYYDLNGLLVGDRVRIENGQLQRW